MLYSTRSRLTLRSRVCLCVDRRRIVMESIEPAVQQAVMFGWWVFGSRMYEYVCGRDAHKHARSGGSLLALLALADHLIATSWTRSQAVQRCCTGCIRTVWAELSSVKQKCCSTRLSWLSPASCSPSSPAGCTRGSPRRRSSASSMTSVPRRSSSSSWTRVRAATGLVSGLTSISRAPQCGTARWPADPQIGS